MKLSPKGFTLVELMIVISIIGILAVVLVPSMNSYLARGRDTSRITSIKEIMTAFAAWELDKSSPPPALAGASSGSAMCTNSALPNIASYIPKFPKDPVSGRTANCGTVGAFGYGTGVDAGDTTTFAVSAVLENANGGNTGSVTAYQGGGFALGQLTVIDGFTRAYGSGYIVRK